MGFDSVVGLTGLVVGVVGTAVAVYTYYATRTKRELLFLITAAEIIGHSESMFPPELKIFFNDEPIQSLVKHNILVWNSGNVPIRHEDFIKQGAPVEMTFPDEFEMLKSAIVRESSSANDISLSVSDDRRSAACKFLFLEPRDGFNVEILHSGDISSDPQIKFNIIGISRRTKYQQHTIWSTVFSRLPEFGTAIFFVVAFQSFLHIEEYAHYVNIFGISDLLLAFILGIFSIIFVGALVLMVVRIRREIRRRPNYPPEELQTSR